jgi:tRNA (guanine-N7-)-methyltransferase
MIQLTYGRRYGRRLGPQRAAALQSLLPILQLYLPQRGTVLDWQALFARPMRELWLEIGFGTGEHLAWQAAHYSDVGLFGCEPFMGGISRLLQMIIDKKLDNIRIYPADARLVIDALPDNSVGRCFILFPDPWPKSRHHRRRFICADTTAALARVMADKAELRLASDHPDLIDWMLFHLRMHGAFEWMAKNASDWRTRPSDWPATRYEAKALHGKPVFLTFRRRIRE